jgi:hypothetical protein
MPDPAIPMNGSAASGPSALSGTAERGYRFQAQNTQIADKLYQAADILSAQGADPFRIAAYRRAADSVCACDDDLGTIAARGGRQALEAIPGVGAAIAGAIAEMLATGRWAFLDRLKGTAEPEMLFLSVPGSDRHSPGLFAKRCRSTPSKGWKPPRMMDDWSRLPVLVIVAPRWSGPPWGACWPGSDALRPSCRKNPRWVCCWRSTASTAIGRRPAN